MPFRITVYLAQINWYWPQYPPFILTNKLPALESATSTDIIRRNMEVLHKARQNFVQSESSEKIQRALCHKVRSYGYVKYSNGDSLLSKKKLQKMERAWSCPSAKWAICSHQTWRGILLCSSMSANKRKSYLSSYA